MSEFKSKVNVRNMIKEPFDNDTNGDYDKPNNYNKGAKKNAGFYKYL
jgi:hypothetical protein